MLDKFESCDSPQDLERLCFEFSQASSFEYFLFVVCTLTSLTAPKLETITNFPKEWMARYFKEDMARNDPVVKYCFENTAPVRWDKLVQLEQYIDAKGSEILEMAREAGLVNGCSIPIRSPNGKIVIFSLATRDLDNVDERLNKGLTEVQVFSNWLFDAYNRIKSTMDQDPKAFKLSARELECLFWACEGKTTWEISQILGITERTVVFHLSCSARKMGASNRQHAVAKAITYGLIKPSL
ncbi:LuxR family transcriptional regulator [Gynuella sunshinyii]|uniref:LuxR family transcriptional regulator n=1 Tax=Gynuella sunshinyii TaxID=1445505 RepID=UPI0014703A2D|nr:LuxR family transcriptional regulator [Gynuella sunshinyii]